ncbi:hypothetical protein [Treponema endosymbiont of Eucomonympha sp.]|uniref:hypothetical protein n=1 Tax=Treponema endosymbiont of Eucomonympha sp. TaxID=1580831 RepID=UPI000785AB2D|nr:hypothetical protein [Treponema endosymbiont of Eucomonympha sp.]
MESALGSTGINATADTTLTIRRTRGTNEATLSITGRDVEDACYALAWESGICSWAVTGQSSLVPAGVLERLGKNEKLTLNVLQGLEGKTKGQPVAVTEWSAKCRKRIDRQAFYRAKEALPASGKIIIDEREAVRSVV